MTVSIESLISQLEELQNTCLKSFETLNSQIQELKKQEDVLAPFNAFLTVELTPYFGPKHSVMIVEKLKRCREIGDYRFFTPAYKIADGDLTKRQLLKLISAVHRYKFIGHKNPEKYALRSEIKYAKACDHCGKLANILYTRLQKEGLI